MHSKNGFKKDTKLTEDIRADTNNVKSSSADKKVFNDLNELINNTKNKTTTRKSTIKKIRNIICNLDHQRQIEKTVFQNKTIDVVYYLFNSLEIRSKPGRLMLTKWVNISEKIFNEILSTVTKAKNKWLRVNVYGREITLNNTENLLKDLGIGLVDGNEFKNRYNDILDDIKTIVDKATITRNKKKSKN